MTSITSNNISSFGVLNEVEQQLLISDGEEKKATKTSIKTKEKSLEKQREERIDNLKERMKMVAGGHNGCLKVLKIITIVCAAVTAPFTMGASFGLSAGVTAALQIATAALAAIGAITNGLEQLQEALKQGKLLLNTAEGQEIMAIIQETQKWIEEEQNLLDDINQDQKDSLEEYKINLKELEASFSSMINI